MLKRYGVTHLVYESNNDDYGMIGNAIQQALHGHADDTWGVFSGGAAQHRAEGTEDHQHP